MSEQSRQHENPDLLLNSYNRQCGDCRRAIAHMSERRALALLKGEVNRPRVSRIRLNNAIAIWQSVAKRAMQAGKAVA